MRVWTQVASGSSAYPVSAYYLRVMVGDRRGDVFSKGRDFAAWLGLVPKQTSSRVTCYLRVLLMQAAWLVPIKPRSSVRHRAEVPD